MVNINNTKAGNRPRLIKIMQNQNPTFNFQLTLEEANYVLAGLQELPGKICNPLSEKIKSQAQEQINAMQAAQADAEKQPAE